MSELLHSEIFDRMPVVGARMRDDLAQRVGETVTDITLTGATDPDVTVLVRSKHNPEQLTSLLDDVKNQRFAGECQVVLVDTDTTSDTRTVARRYGATLVSIAQKDFSYPTALNTGFEAADHPYVFTFVDHSLLPSQHTLQSATRWQATPNFAGAYGVALPNSNATWTERVGAVILGVPRVLGKAATQIDKPGMGFMAANASVVVKAAWEEVEGYDPAFGAGGEDGDFGKRLLEAGGTVILDPALSVFHTHGVGPVNGFRQYAAWLRMGKPAPFNGKKLKDYRPDLQ